MKKLIFTLMVLAIGFVAKAQYAVGDPYKKDGVDAIVIHVDESGEHGLIMSLPENKNTKDRKDDLKNWNDRYIPFSSQDYANAVYDSITEDGKHNMAIIENYCANNSLDLKVAFPLFAWAKSLGEGWYIPGDKEAIYYSNCVAFGCGRDRYENIQKKEIDQKRTDFLKKINLVYGNYIVPDCIKTSSMTKHGKRKGYITAHLVSFMTNDRLGYLGKKKYWWAIITNVENGLTGRKFQAVTYYPIAVCEF